MHIPSPRGARKARIEIIPLIDIVFFLLATFVMVSLSMVKNQGVTVNLPVAQSGEAQPRENETTISITEEGAYFFNKEPMELPALIQRLERLKQEELEPRLFINGDRKAEFGKAIAVLDEARKLGITKVAIQTVQQP